MNVRYGKKNKKPKSSVEYGRNEREMKCIYKMKRIVVTVFLHIAIVYFSENSKHINTKNKHHSKGIQTNQF